MKNRANTVKTKSHERQVNTVLTDTNSSVERSRWATMEAITLPRVSDNPSWLKMYAELMGNHKK